MPSKKLRMLLIRQPRQLLKATRRRKKLKSFSTRPKRTIKRPLSWLRTKRLNFRRKSMKLEISPPPKSLPSNEVEVNT